MKTSTRDWDELVGSLEHCGISLTMKAAKIKVRLPKSSFTSNDCNSTQLALKDIFRD